MFILSSYQNQSRKYKQTLKTKAMRNLITAAAFMIVSATSFSQTLHQITSGEVEVNPQTALRNTVVQSMVFDNERPYTIEVFRVNGVSHDFPYCSEEGGVGVLPMGEMTSEEADFEFYASLYVRGDTVQCAFFDQETYMIVCSDMMGEEIGEGLVIMMNNNFIDAGLEQGFYEERDEDLHSTYPMRVGRPSGEFICFN